MQGRAPRWLRAAAVATLALLVAAVSALAVTSSVSIRAVDPNERAVRFSTIVLDSGPDEQVVRNEDDDDRVAGILLPAGNHLVAVTDSEGQRREGVLVVPEGAGPHDLTVRVVRPGWWSRRSTAARYGIIGGGAGIGLGVALIAGGSKGGDGDANGDGNGGGGGGTGLGTCPGPFSVTFGGFQQSGGCPNLLGNRTCTLAGAAGADWSLDCSLFRVAGPFNLTTGRYTAQGLGDYSAARNVTYRLEADFTAGTGECNFTGWLQVGPPLLGASEFCRWGIVSGRGTR